MKHHPRINNQQGANIGAVIWVVIIVFSLCTLKCNGQYFKDSLYKNNIWYYTKDSNGIKNFYPLTHYFKYRLTVTGVRVSISGKTYYADNCKNCVISVTQYYNNYESYIAPPKKWVFTKASEIIFFKYENN